MTIGELLRRYEGVHRGGVTPFSITGRVTAVRANGDTMFFDLDDTTGRIQVWASRRFTAGFGQLKHDVTGGRWIKVEGPVRRTKAGELSLKTLSYTSL